MADRFLTRIDGEINAREVSIGVGVVVEPGVVITGNEGPAQRVVLGDFCYIGRHARIMVPDFSLGDYSKLHNFSLGRGERPLHIGRNCWIGGNVVLDSMGDLRIDDNVGIGAHSQLWTHIQFGDIVEGCRFYSKRPMHVKKDAWFVGHCIVSPVSVGERSMALVGSVVTRDMEPNRVYAGVPATDVTEKVGPQFTSPSVEEKAARLQDLIDRFVATHPEYREQLLVATSPEDIRPNVCCFDVSRRVYTKTYSAAEVAFLKAHTPLIKFTPDREAAFVPELVA